MIDPKTVAAERKFYVRPRSFPLAIRLIAARESLPAKAKRPRRDPGVPIATCRAVSMARRYGWTIGVGREDLNCVLTKTACGFEEQVPCYTAGHCSRGLHAETWAASAKTEAETHERGGAITSSFAGRLDCSDEIIGTMPLPDDPEIFPCSGDRRFDQPEDHQMALSLPVALADEFIEGLKGTQQGGIPCPIPSFLRSSGQFPPSYQQLENIWSQEKQE
jgi:uncharacterized protein (DUF169 family)